MNKPKKLVVHIDKIIKERKMPIAELARQAGVDPGRLGGLINGDRERITVEYLTLAAEALGIEDISELITLEDAEPDEENQLVPSLKSKK